MSNNYSFHNFSFSCSFSAISYKIAYKVWRRGTNSFLLFNLQIQDISEKAKERKKALVAKGIFFKNVSYQKAEEKETCFWKGNDDTQKEKGFRFGYSWIYKILIRIFEENFKFFFEALKNQGIGNQYCSGYRGRIPYRNYVRCNFSGGVLSAWDLRTLHYRKKNL